MKILLLADDKSNQLRQLLTEKPDIILTLGDLEPWMVEDIYNLNIPKIGIYGNHENTDFFEKTNTQNIHMKTYEFKGIKFTGFQGAFKYKPHSHRDLYTQEEASLLIDSLPQADIVISHSPPYGIHDNINVPESPHQGFQGLNTYIEKHAPQYLFHGHTHPKSTSEDNILKTKKGETQVIWSYGANIIEI
jgi:uncharacterized protein